MEHNDLIIPATIAQRAIWMGQTIEPDNSAYNVAIQVNIDGPLAVDIFTHAVVQTIAMTESLHAVYQCSDQAPFELLQRLGRCELESMQRIDLRQSPDATAAATSWMNQDRFLPIDLSRDRLFCIALFHLATDRAIFYLRAHHIALDAYGLALILQRIEQLYHALLTAKDSQSLPKFESQRIVVDDEIAYINSDKHQLDQAFWDDYMSNTGPIMSLTSACGLPAAQVLRQDFCIPVQEVAWLESLATYHRTNNAFLVLSMFAAYLAEVTAMSDIVLGLPMMCRMSRQSLMVPTTLANVLPLRLSLSPHTSLSHLIALVKEQMATLTKHQFFRSEVLRQRLKLVGKNRRLVGPVFNIDVFPSHLRLQHCSAVIHPLATGPIHDFAVTLKMKTKEGTMPLIMMANSRTYPLVNFNHHALSFYHFLMEFLKKSSH